MDTYLDYQASKPVDERVLTEMMPYFDEFFANPASLHNDGDFATKALVNARAKVADFVNASDPSEIIFTSGATESNNLALIGAAERNKRKGNHIIISEVEHISIRNIGKYLERNGFEVDRVPVDQYGKVRLEKFKNLIREDTILVSIQWANNEIGTIQPIEEIGQITEEKDIVFHSDAIASEPYVPIDVQKVPLDLITLSSNDIYGPKGVGALYMRKGQRVNPIIIGGGQERGIRSGSENMHGLVGFGKAAEIMKREMNQEATRLKKLRDHLINGVLDRIDNSYLNGHPEDRLPHNINLRFDFIEGESLILSLKDEKIAAASGSACTSKTLEPSHTLISCGLLHEEAHGSLLFTLGRFTKDEDIDKVLAVLPDIVKKLRLLSPLTPPDMIKKYKQEGE
ncbi:MAG: cysteine desulfurase (tRNA sulfurtransferase), PLP-dependent [Promethearchaeota archaeon]|nr:MAG: cysteine desulfurase (tRNA sulfurtransferase), PLP-dependent [Candidatus Lokiarchaeota archaeon]